MKTSPFDKTITLKFSGAHCLIMGNVPLKEKQESSVKDIGEQISKTFSDNVSQEMVQNFGLFGGESQYNHFVPVKEEDWTVSEGDFIYPMFRLLSEALVFKAGVPIDFSGGALKPSMNRLKGVTVYPDHKNDEVGNSLGAVFEVVWQEAYVAEGTKVPAGVNGILKIDAKSNPRIARGLNMEPPSIHSGSVSVTFEWEKSHDLEDFWDKAGTFDEKGNLIRLIVTKITRFNEFSLVSHGADVFAQKIHDGKIVNPTYAKSAYRFDADEQNEFFVNFKQTFELEDSLTLQFNNNPIKIPKMKSLILLLNAALFAGNPLSEELTEEALSQALQDQFKALSEDKTLVTSLREVMPTLSKETLTELVSRPQMTEEQIAILAKVEEAGSLDSLILKAKQGEDHLQAVRDKAIANYKLANPEAPSEAIIKTIENADLETALAFEKTYTEAFEKLVPLSCKECGSHNVSRASSGGTTKTSNQEEIKEEFITRSRKPSDIHSSK